MHRRASREPPQRSQHFILAIAPGEETEHLFHPHNRAPRPLLHRCIDRDRFCWLNS
jgi:hypothetical protein